MPNITSNQILSQSAKQYWLHWLFAIIWNGMTWYAIIMGGNNILKALEANPVFYFFALFPFIGLWIIVIAIKETLAWYKFGKTPITLNPFPAQVGGLCAGYIDLPIPAKNAPQAVLSLSCIRRYISRSHDGKHSTREEAIWQDRLTLKPDNYRKSIRLNFAFAPPANLPPSEEKSDSYHLWKLNIRIALPGIDYDRIFELPLTAADQDAIATNSRIQAKTSTIIEHRDTEIGSIPTITKTTNGTKFHYGYGRAKVVAFALILMGAFFAVFAHYFFAGFQNFLPTTTSLMTFLAYLTALIIFLLGLFLIANSLSTEVNLMGVSKQQRTFGFLLEEKIEAKDIVDITVEKNGSSTSGNTTKVWFCLKLITRDGKKIEVGDSLEGQSYAEQIRQEMLSALGLSWKPAILTTPINEVTPIPTWLYWLRAFFSKKQSERPLPIWLRWPKKLLSNAFLIAFIYDMHLLFPQATDFVSKLLP